MSLHKEGEKREQGSSSASCSLLLILYLLHQACSCAADVLVCFEALMTAREKSSPQERQKSPLSLWDVPPIAVNCTSAGFPHHSQRLPRGAESIETGLRNSL